MYEESERPTGYFVFKTQEIKKILSKVSQLKLE